MKIIGPIAGIGSRLRPFTLSKPKAFLTVAGKTVLDHILIKFTNTFDSDTDLILIVGYKRAFHWNLIYLFLYPTVLQEPFFLGIGWLQYEELEWQIGRHVGRNYRTS